MKILLSIIVLDHLPLILSKTKQLTFFLWAQTLEVVDPLLHFILKHWQ